MSKDKRQKARPQMIAATRDYLDRAVHSGVTLKGVIQQVRKCGLELNSEYDTIRKFRTGERDALSTEEDYFTFYTFFTEHAEGRFLVRSKNVEPNDSQEQAISPVAGKSGHEIMMHPIGPVGTPRVTNLTNGMRVASLSVEGSQWGFGTVGLAVTIACPAWHGFAVQRGLVVMDPHPGRLSEHAEQYWAEQREFRTEAYGRPGRVEIVLGYCTRLDPFWEVTGKGTPIGKFSTGPEFAPLEGLSPGDRVTVTFGTWLGDLQDSESAEVATADDATFLTDGLAPANATADAAKIADIEGKKRRLIALIRQTGLNSASDGYTDLVKCEIDIGER